MIAFLQSDTEVFDRLVTEGESLADARKVVTDAKKLATGMSSLPVDRLRELFAATFYKVIVRENSIEIKVNRKVLRQVLENGTSVVASNPNGARKADKCDLITLTIEVKRKRCGGEVHLVVSPTSLVLVERPKPALIKALARAYGWYEKIIRGEAPNIRSLARQAGLTDRYVAKVFGCVLLAPDIIESILSGHQPRDLSFQKLCRNIPLNWAEQREQFGFPPISSRNSSLN